MKTILSSYPTIWLRRANPSDNLRTDKQTSKKTSCSLEHNKTPRLQTISGALQLPTENQNEARWGADGGLVNELSVNLREAKQTIGS